MKKLLLAGALAAVSLATSVSAQPLGQYGGTAPYRGPVQAPYRGYAPRTPVAPAQNPAAVLRKGLDGLIAFLDQKPSPDQLQIAAHLEAEVAPLFDFNYMAQVAAGSAMRQMNDEQRAKLEGKLKVLFLGALAERLTEYDGQKINYLPPRRNRGRGDQVSLGVAIQNPAGYPAQLQFRLRRGDGGWKVIDVAANGSSALAYYRNYFRRAASNPSMATTPRGRYR